MELCKGAGEGARVPSAIGCGPRRPRSQCNAFVSAPIDLFGRTTQGRFAILPNTICDRSRVLAHLIRRAKMRRRPRNIRFEKRPESP